MTISLPTDLLEFADRLAHEKSLTRSGLLVELLAKEERAELMAQMAEGYREMAEENQQLAEAAFPSAAEEIARSTEWDE